jgi:hypothetical protein
MEDGGFEPPTFRMRSEHSTPELIPHIPVSAFITLSECRRRRKFSFLSELVTKFIIIQLFDMNYEWTDSSYRNS